MDSTLALKLVLVPALIGAASLAGRRFGPAVSGWLVALPFTSAPIIFFLALAHGAAFAADSAMGTLAGGLSIAAYSLVYAWLAPRLNWVITTLAALGALSALNLGLQYLRLPLPALALTVAAALALTLRLIAPAGDAEPPPAGAPAWDIPARMLAATAFVVIITALAPLIGPRLSGLFATFPLIAGTVVSATHWRRGARSAQLVLRGLVLGMFAFTGFYTVVIALLAHPQWGLVPAGVGLAFGAAILAALIVEGFTLWIIRR